MSKLEQLLSELVDEADLASDIDNLIAKYARKVRSCIQEDLAKPYRLLACQDSGHHMGDMDDQGRCVFCEEFG